MTELRTRMDNDMLVRGMAERTREAYLAAVTRLARHYHRAPDRLSPAEVQAYLVHMLREEHLAWSTCNIAVQAFRFLYHTTLGRAVPAFTIPAPKQPQRLPEILSPAEVRAVLEAAATRKQRAVLATTYAAGLRVGEVAGSSSTTSTPHG
jgi:integrase/recombinase XerD